MTAERTTNRRAVAVPDWSIVTTEAARTALKAAFDALDMGHQWIALEEAEDRVRQAILRLYGRSGRAPIFKAVADEAGVPRGDISDLLHRLAVRDLIVLDDGGHIIGAYPFSERATEHCVRVGTVVVAAMCAIDALGIGAMLGIDTNIRSACRHCGRIIEVATCGGGRALGTVAPANALVWSGIHYDGCAAASLCTVQAFFCSEGHLDVWRDADWPSANGVRLSMEEAFQVARAIFEPMLTSGAMR